MYKAFDGDFVPEKVGYLEKLILERHGSDYSGSDEICINLPEGVSSSQELKPNSLWLEDHIPDDSKAIEFDCVMFLSEEHMSKVREAFTCESGTIYLHWVEALANKRMEKTKKSGV